MILILYYIIVQGNGHERDFTNDENVYIMDVYNSDIYPHDLRAKRMLLLLDCIELFWLW